MHMDGNVHHVIERRKGHMHMDGAEAVTVATMLDLGAGAAVCQVGQKPGAELDVRGGSSMISIFWADLILI
ncbi:hypothetical protein L484_014292 [Morus notabilis]|uniref:Uncharacterized protein n=1 Tax=Morus notabilis TaxID=981085 RepID=W9RBS9_9ROSA|nr:hypothetical protein L484_014292 [Morus notabilis]